MVPQPDVETDGAPDSVLVVDDDAVIRLVLAEAMRDAGLRVIEARSGDDAMNYLSSGGHVDLIFSDVRMAGPVDGIRLARDVRAKYPAIPVILTSATALPVRLDESQIFIRKPFQLDQVLALIVQTLRSTD
jgi:CheY-like chemotaxis protein